MFEKFMYRRIWDAKRLELEQYGEEIPKKTGKLIDRVLLIWALSIYAVAIIFDENILDLADCDICLSLAEVIPAIDRMSTFTDFPQATRAVWIYLYIGFPVPLFFLLQKAKSIRYGQRRLRFFLVFTTFAVGSSLALFYGFYGQAEGKFLSLFAHTLFGMVLGATAFSGIILASIMNLAGIFLETTNNKY